MDSNQFFQYAFWGCCIAGVLFSNAPNLYLVPEDKGTFKVLFWRDKADFTPEGWRLWQVAVAFSYLGVMVAAVGYCLA